MRIATILFTYHRYKHTKAVLEGIKNNTILPEKLFIFQDGINEKTNVEGWKKVNSLINGVDFCKTELIISENNYGLAKSVVSGINYVMKQYEAVIVLEDDCVPHPKYIEYSLSALNKYKDNKEVWSVNGFSENIVVTDNGYDAYFTGRIESWGWATWRDRWDYYEEDYRIIRKIKSNQQKEEQFRIWGEDLERYLYGNIEGKCDSWATFWGLIVIFHGGYCLTPNKSLIKNIGGDGTGEHCKSGYDLSNVKDFNDRGKIELPDRIVFPDNYRDAFIDLYHRTSTEKKNLLYKNLLLDWLEVKNSNISIADRLLKNGIHIISIWGTGRISKLLIDEIRDNVKISQIIKTNNSDGQTEFEGVPVVDLGNNDLNTGIDVIVVIPFYDIDIIRRKMELKKIRIQCVGIDEILSGTRR